MSAAPETDLFTQLAGTPTEDAAGLAFVQGLSEAARLHRAARALADEAWLLGEYVDEEEAPEEAALLAAQDTDAPPATAGARYTDGRLRIWLRPADGAFEAIQEAGPGGVALETPDGLVPLQREQPQPVPGFDALPDQLVVLDRRGRAVTLERTTTP